MREHKSQTTSSTGKAAIVLTVFCIIWDSVVFGLMLKQTHIPFWFKSIFVIAALFLTGLAIYLWWQRIAGGVVQLHLPQDPLPHGIAHSIQFHLSRSIQAQNYQVHLQIAAKQRSSSSFGRVWEQEFPAQALSDQHVQASITLPSDYPSSQSHQDGADYRITLTLYADKLHWEFDLETRPAIASEQLMHHATSRELGTKVPQYTPEQALAMRKKFMRWIAVFAFVIIGLQLYHFLGDLIPWSPIQKAKAAVIPGSYSTQNNTEPFELLITNNHISDWALRSRLLGIAQVQDGELIVKLSQLDIRPMNKCDQVAMCAVKSARLLLSKAGENSFSTLATSEELEINANLAELGRWQLPSDQQDKTLRMRLPASIDADTMRLKLELRSQSGSTVYPQNGPYLNLHNALAKATGKKDACASLQGLEELATAGCTQQLQTKLSGQAGLWVSIQNLGNDFARVVKIISARIGITQAPSAPANTLDALLITSIKNENAQTTAMLVSRGAAATALDSEYQGRSALGYAAASNDIATLQMLLANGANANLRLHNDRGQIVTPLTQALRTDPAQAVEMLLQKGASLSIQDPQGWTPMHIAAYESAHQSVAVMARFGGDVNEKTPSYRQQTAFHTALQFANEKTIRTMLDLGADLSATDNQGQNACGWAEFFKRSTKIHQWVCTNNTSTISIDTSATTSTLRK